MARKVAIVNSSEKLVVRGVIVLILARITESCKSQKALYWYSYEYKTPVRYCTSTGRISSTLD